MKAHTIGESLVMLAAKILVKNVIGVKAAAKLLYSSLTTRDNDVKTELLTSKEISSTTKGKDVFEVLNNFFQTE